LNAKTAKPSLPDNYIVVVVPTITFSSLQRGCLLFFGGLIYENHPCGELKKVSVLSMKIMVVDIYGTQFSFC